MTTHFVASWILTIVPCLGAAAAIVLGVLDLLKCHRLVRWLYIR
jgi:hypothetical protein